MSRMGHLLSLLKLGLFGESSEIPYPSYSTIVAVGTSSEGTNEFQDASTEHCARNGIDHYMGYSVVVHAGKVVLKIVANRPARRRGCSWGEQCGAWRQRSATDMIFVVRRLEKLGRPSNPPLSMCFIDIYKAYDFVNRTLL